MKYIVKKTTKHESGITGVYYITEHYSWPNELKDSIIKDGFDDYNKAFNFLLVKKSYDQPFVKKGFKFEYEVVEVE